MQDQLSFGPKFRVVITILTLIFIVSMPLVFPPPEKVSSTWTWLALGAMELFALLILLAMWLPPRSAHVSKRVGAALLAAIFIAIAVQKVYFTPEALTAGGTEGKSTWRSITAVGVLALPCLYFAVFGRLRSRSADRATA